MFENYEVITVFGIAAILSFTVSVSILLLIAAKRGLLRAGKRKTMIVQPTLAVMETRGQVGSPLLVTPSAPPLPMVVELAPLKDYA